MGVLVIGLAMLTDHELGLLRLIPMPVHRMVDLGAGGFLLVSPWVFGFAGFIAWPHILFGISILVVAHFSRTTPATPAAPYGGSGPGRP